MREESYDDEEYEDEDNFYSPTSWDRLPGETDEQYADRIQDQEDYLESFL